MAPPLLLRRLPLRPYTTHLKDHRIPSIGTGVSCDVRVVQPGKFDPVTHSEYFGQKTVKRTDAHPALHRLAIKDYLVAHLVAELAKAVLTDNLGDNGEPLILALAFFGHVSLLYDKVRGLGLAL